LSVAQSLTRCDDPLVFVISLDEEELEAMAIDASDFVELEASKRSKQQTSFASLWSSLLQLISCESSRRSTRRDSAIHKTVGADIHQLLEGKSNEELSRLVQDIEDSVRTGRETDVEHWRLMMEEIKYEIEKRNFVLAFEEIQRMRDEILDSLAPQLMTTKAALKSRTDANAVQSASSAPDDHESGETDENMQVSDEVALPSKNYSWQDKYRPRKPRYLNRVSVTSFCYLKHVQ